MLILELIGPPVPWAAPVLSRGRFYNKKHTEKEQAIWQLKSQFNRPQFSGPVKLDVIFYRAIPKSTSAIRRKQMLNGMIYPIEKPDRSNCLKFIEDCLEGAGVLSNDSIIVDGNTKKLYGDVAKTVLFITDINQLNERT
jgi:Holliday junction resolvase RusA-like endonuclease